MIKGEVSIVRARDGWNMWVGGRLIHMGRSLQFCLNKMLGFRRTRRGANKRRRRSGYTK